MKKFCIRVLVGVSFVFLIECCSIDSHYELEAATVRKVVPDSRGFMGADEMTLVRFDDGFDTEVSGSRGEPGDRVMAYRKRGTRSFLGWVGHVSIFKSTPTECRVVIKCWNCQSKSK